MSWDFIDYLVFAMAFPLSMYCAVFGGVRVMRKMWQMDVPYDRRLKISGNPAKS